MDTIGERIRARRKALSITQQGLAEAFGISRVSVTLWENNSTSPERDKISRLAEILEADPEWLLTGQGTPPEEPPQAYRMRMVRERVRPSTPKPKPNASFPPRWQAFPADVRIPLRGHIAAGANGRFILNGQDIAHVFCPPGLEGVEGAYAVQIEGTSGEPRFYHGETAWVNPHTKVRQGDDVIVQILGDDDDDEVSSYLKRFVSRSGDVLRLYQYNPGKGESHELEFPADKVFSVHKVVFHAML